MAELSRVMRCRMHALYCSRKVLLSCVYVLCLVFCTHTHTVRLGHYALVMYNILPYTKKTITSSSATATVAVTDTKTA
jgi:hypothetical protein